MRNFFGLILIPIVFIFTNCKSEKIDPFELSIADYNYSMAYSVLYKLTDKKLTITFQGELENEKDSLLYTTTDLPYEAIKKISQIKIDSLGVLYSNPCISDGDIKLYIFNKNGIKKKIQVENYYHNELSPAIEIINDIVPQNFKIYHNKERLIKNLEKCGASNIRMAWKNN
jgi:hypothetical protein